MLFIDKLRLTHWSTYSAFLVWGSGAFTSQPTLASFAVHFAILPLFLVVTVLLAHREGRLAANKAK